MTDAIKQRLADAGLRVKPLEWRDCEPDPIFGIVSRANHSFIEGIEAYAIYSEEAEGDDDVIEEGGPSFYFDFDSKHPTPEAAKEAAQTDYEARILAALEVMG